MFLCRFIGLMVCLLTRILKMLRMNFYFFFKLEKVGIKSCQMVGVIWNPTWKKNHQISITCIIRSIISLTGRVFFRILNMECKPNLGVPSLSLPPLFSLLSFPYLVPSHSLPLPVPSLSSRPLNQANGSGEHCRIWFILALKSDIWWQ